MESEVTVGVETKRLPRTLLSVVEERLHERVCASEPDDVLSEASLAREFGTSRSLVRIAVSKLVADGLLCRLPGKGTVVTHKALARQRLRYCATEEELRSGLVDRAVRLTRETWPRFVLEPMEWTTPQDDVLSILEERVHARAHFHGIESGHTRFEEQGNKLPAITIGIHQDDINAATFKKPSDLLVTRPHELLENARRYHRTFARRDVFPDMHHIHVHLGEDLLPNCNPEPG